MMNVKKYRAETTREALEKIKLDIGDDAFVLETKQVRAGGFMGFGTKMQVEISAIPALDSELAKVGKNDEIVFAQSSFLNFNENSPALPGNIDSVMLPKRSKLTKALQSRAESDKSLTRYPKSNGTGVSLLGIDAVEISAEAPRVVFHKTEKFEKTSDAIEPAVKNNSEAKKIRPSNRELDLLRAELREVKFSINSIAARQTMVQKNGATDAAMSTAVRKPPFSDAYQELIALGITNSMANLFVSKVIPAVKKGTVDKSDIVRASLELGINSFLKFGEDPLSGEKPAVMAVIGSTGVGKTTTVAKLAARIALEERRPVELVTLDTYRIAAVEQLVTYAEIIGAGCHVVRSVLELEGLLRRLPADATVLIDTTGKNPHDLADQHEFSKYLAKHKEIKKCLAVQATTHPVDAFAAIKKFEMYGVDCLAITKLDETTRPGATIDLIAESGLPLTYLGVGQRVPEDLKVATSEYFVSRILGETV